MTKHDKTLEKMKRLPPPSDLRWDELKALLQNLGYQMLKGDGSRRKFHHPETGALISCHMPHPSPNVDKGCVADVVQHLSDYGFIKDKDNGNS